MDEIEQLKIDLRLAILTRWLYVLVAIAMTLIIAYLIGYVQGLYDTVNYYQIAEIKEVINMTVNTTGIQIVEFH